MNGCNWADLPHDFKPKGEPLAGTTWKRRGVCGETVYTFEKDGRLTYSYGSSCWPNGTWKLDGYKLTWDVNLRYAWFSGTVKDGVITGTAENVTTKTWALTYKKDPTAKHPKEPSEQVFPRYGR